MIKRFSFVLFALFLILSSGVLYGCGVDYTDEEVANESEKLIEASYELNEIYFGKGLPVVDRFGAEEYEVEEGKYDVQAVTYLPVSEDSKYITIDQIKEATEKVYSTGYCNYLFEKAFDGISTDDENAVYALYIENEYGILTARSDLRLKGLELCRTYDFDSIKVGKKRDESVEITVDSLYNGEKDITVNFTLVKESDGWKLDSPTY